MQLSLPIKGDSERVGGAVPLKPTRLAEWGNRMQPGEEAYRDPLVTSVMHSTYPSVNSTRPNFTSTVPHWSLSPFSEHDDLEGMTCLCSSCYVSPSLKTSHHMYQMPPALPYACVSERENMQERV